MQLALKYLLFCAVEGDATLLNIFGRNEPQALVIVFVQLKNKLLKQQIATTRALSHLTLLSGIFSSALVILQTQNLFNFVLRGIYTENQQLWALFSCFCMLRQWLQLTEISFCLTKVSFSWKKTLKTNYFLHSSLFETSQ